MDALAGYGSDSSDASAPKKAPLSGLLAHYSDDDDDDVEEPSSVPCGVPSSELSTTKNKDSSNSSANNNNIHANSCSPPTKKQKMVPLLQQQQQQGLPPPRLTASSTTEPTSWIELRQDYTTKYRSAQVSESSSLQQQEAAQEAQLEWGPTLQSLHDTFYASSSTSSTLLPTNNFATHLKSQKDFGNPHMFPSVISHFGIEAHGSNLDTTIMVDAFDDFEYANRLVTAEEQARIRASERSQQQHQQQQSQQEETLPSVNDQIQRAMSSTSNHIQTNRSAL
eukprot:scaffold98053_cov34-Attheya_sp.AAC.2